MDYMEIDRYTPPSPNEISYFGFVIKSVCMCVWHMVSVLPVTNA